MRRTPENADRAAEGEITADISEAEMSEAEIDAIVEDSFPASDPPPWTLGTDHRASAKRDDVE